MAKYRISGDCTSGLAETHLATPQYFSIRIFRQGKWRGNIYVLDFTDRYGILLVDRIQVPRYLKAEYINFYEHLREMFEDMFADVRYAKILLPTVISNHGSIQKAFNQYKKHLNKVKFEPEFAQKESFDGFRRGKSFFVLSVKEK